MVSHMKTTLNIDDTVMARLRREAARTGRTMSELVETALRQLLQHRTDDPKLATLATFDSGGTFLQDRSVAGGGLKRTVRESRHPVCLQISL